MIAAFKQGVAHWRMNCFFRGVSVMCHFSHHVIYSRAISGSLMVSSTLHRSAQCAQVSRRFWWSMTSSSTRSRRRSPPGGYCRRLGFVADVVAVIVEQGRKALHSDPTGRADPGSPTVELAVRSPSPIMNMHRMRAIACGLLGVTFHADSFAAAATKSSEPGALDERQSRGDLGFDNQNTMPVLTRAISLSAAGFSRW